MTEPRHRRRPRPGLRTAILAATACLAFAPVGDADEMYRWVDPQGNVHFSDQPPPPGMPQQDQWTAPEFVAPPPNPYAIVDQLQRLQAQREAAVRARLEQQEREARLRQLERDAQRSAAPPPDEPPGSYAPLYVYPGTPPNPGWRPRPPRPGHGSWTPTDDHPTYWPNYGVRPAPRPPPAPKARLAPLSPTKPTR